MEKLKDKLIKNYLSYKSVIDDESGIYKELSSKYRCYAVPELSREVISLKDLHGLRENLFV